MFPNRCLMMKRQLVIFLFIHVLEASGHQKESFYKINWRGSLPKDRELGTTSSANSSSFDDKNDETFDADGLLNMITADKEKYQCILPATQPTSEKNMHNESEIELNPYRLLLPLFSREVCSFRLEQYWSYELCHGRHIKQFHHESHEKSFGQEYFLGEYDLSQLKASEKEYEQKMDDFKSKGEKRPTVLIDGVHLPYIEINMTGGTTCDLNSKPRFTRILYVCNDESRHELSSIKETYSCEYEAIVMTPLLCAHPDFKNDVGAEIPIDCFSLGDSPKEPKGSSQFKMGNQTKSTD